MNKIEATLETELAHLLNRHSAENDSDTPDFVLARFLMSCMDAWNAGVARREEWYGRKCGDGAALAALAPDDSKDADAQEVPGRDWITDGYQEWPKRCAMCGKDTMQVVRPGKVQCSECG